MAPISPEQLEKHVAHALSARLNPEYKKPADYSDPKTVFAYLREQLMQCNVVSSWDPKDELRNKINQSIEFYSAVAFRIAGLEGASAPSVHKSYDTDTGNQIDMFLERIGYLNR